MAQRFYEPITRIFTNAGAVGVGYKYYFYLTGTTTPVTTYQDINLTVANTNPVISDSNGRLPEIWYSDLSQLKLIVKDSLDNTIETCDPVGATAEIVSLNDFDVRPTSYWGLTTGTSTAYTLLANPTVISYNNSQTFIFQAHIANAINPTMAVSGLPALNLKKYTGQGTKVALQANDLQAAQRYVAINDGVDIVVLNPRSLVINSGAAAALTIATGVVAVTNVGSAYAIDTESSASTDDLDTINGGADGDIIYLRSANNARKVVIKHATGNIWNPQNNNASNRDITLDLNNADFVCLRYSSVLGYWIIISSSFNNFVNSKNTSGYTYLPNGLIMQWGEEASFHDVTTDYTTTITFAITFPTAALQAVVGYKGSTNSGANNDITSSYANLTTTGLTLNMGETSTAGNSVKGNWWAIGY